MGALVLPLSAGFADDGWVPQRRQRPARSTPQPRPRSADPTTGRATATIDRIAATKGLPPAFLHGQLGWKDSSEGVVIPYFAPDGAVFRQRIRQHVVATSGTRWDNQNGKGAIVYGADRLAQADPGAVLLALEGETDAATAWHAGILAIGFPGANTVRTALRAGDIDHFSGLDIWREPDEGGEAFVRGFRKRLPELGYRGEVRVITPPPGIKDLSDLYLVDPETFVERLPALRATATPLWDSDADEGGEEIAEVPATEEPTPVAGRDDGLTKQLADAILEEDHFALGAGGALYYFRDGVYVRDGERHVERRVKHLLTAWGRVNEWSPQRGPHVAKFIAIDAPRLWERPPLDRINLLNGVLHVETRTLVPHDPAFLSTVQLPVRYDLAARSAAWDRFVAATFPEDARALAYEMVAALMTPDTSHQKALLLVGEGANGKSVYLAALTAFLGKDNVANAALHGLAGNRFASATLVGKLANICADLPSTHLAERAGLRGPCRGRGGQCVPGRHGGSRHRPREARGHRYRRVRGRRDVRC